MDQLEAQEKIKQLSKKIIDIKNRANNEGRDLNREETRLTSEMRGAIEALELFLPVNGPLTVQGFSGAGPSNGPFGSFGEQLGCIAMAGSPGGQIDPRLYQVRNAASGLSETVPADGGFLVQQDFTNELLQDVLQKGIIAPLCRRIQISGNSNGIKINGFDETSRASTRYGGILGYWADEAEEKTKSKPKFRQIELVLKKLIGLCYSSDELLADATALDSVIRNAFTSEFRFRIDDVILNGTGAGQPLGVLNSGCLVAVSKEDGQAGSTIVAENIFKMWSRLMPGSEATAVWLAHKTVLPQLYTLSIAVGTGGSAIYMPANQAAGQPYNTLLGRPVLIVEQCQTLGTQGDIILADFQNGYILAEKGGIQADMSIHVRYIYDESVFRFVLRVDGQPVRATALTPFKGTDDLSHFIVTETRS